MTLRREVEIRDAYHLASGVFLHGTMPEYIAPEPQQTRVLKLAGRIVAAADRRAFPPPETTENET